MHSRAELLDLLEDCRSCVTPTTSTHEEISEVLGWCDCGYCTHVPRERPVANSEGDGDLRGRKAPEPPAMTVPSRGKLVRDRIPEIITEAGLVPVIETAPPEDYPRYVRAKLKEELEEYLGSGDVAELADLIEVVFAASALHGVGQTELLAIALDKRQQRGAFAKRLVWLGNEV
jgi:predicted house-cleaning noncanonical NTP pyrophosphatase (MazG superfamily)